jgi:HJR/Mrr/RecB family endonuclease
MTKTIFSEPVGDDSYSMWVSDDKDSLQWSAGGVFDRNTWEDWAADGRLPGSDWLYSLAEEYLTEMPSRTPSAWNNNLSAADLAANFHRLFPKSFSDIFLDSFSVVENGEAARRYEREIVISPLQQALLRIAKDRMDTLKEAFSPREFEVVVACALKDLGFEKVLLRRYTKDDGADIVAVMASGERDETAIVEVKHQSRVSGLEVLDRLNGARDRLGADRAILVTSGHHIARDGKKAYRSKRDVVVAYTFRELLSLIKDMGDWKTTPGGLWTKSA